jgi:hypothetical protein
LCIKGQEPREFQNRVFESKMDLVSLTTLADAGCEARAHLRAKLARRVSMKRSAGEAEARAHAVMRMRELKEATARPSGADVVEC